MDNQVTPHSVNETQQSGCTIVRGGRSMIAVCSIPESRSRMGGARIVRPYVYGQCPECGEKGECPKCDRCYRHCQCGPEEAS